jgi:hypothetical protein
MVEFEPRVLNDPGRTTVFRLDTDADLPQAGRTKEVFRLVSSGSGGWTPIYETRSSATFRVTGGSEMLVRFALTQNAQLWADAERPIRFEIREAATTRPEPAPRRYDVKASAGAFVEAPWRGEIDVPIDGAYAVSVRARAPQGGSLRLSIGGPNVVPLTALGAEVEPGGEFDWHALGRVDLAAGVTTLAVASDRPLDVDAFRFARLDGAAPPAAREGPAQSFVDVARVRASDYRVRNLGSGRRYVEFAETYDRRWRFERGDDTGPRPFRSWGLGNGFEVELSGDENARLYFGGQDPAVIGEYVSRATWVVVGVLLIGPALLRLRRRK